MHNSSATRPNFQQIWFVNSNEILTEQFYFPSLFYQLKLTAPTTIRYVIRIELYTLKQSSRLQKQPTSLEIDV